MDKSNKILLILIICFASVLVLAQGAELKIPAEVQPFIEKDMKPIALETGDLNGDGKMDFIMVLEKATTSSKEENTDESERPMLIIIRKADGKLTLSTRNDEVVYCRNCGGVYGDPFDSVKIGNKGFTVFNVGGSSDRWLENFQFNYSPRDKTWQLVRAVFSSYNVFKPKLIKTRILTPPKDYGKINFADFRLSNLEQKNKN